MRQGNFLFLPFRSLTLRLLSRFKVLSVLHDNLILLITFSIIDNLTAQFLHPADQHLSGYGGLDIFVLSLSFFLTHFTLLIFCQALIDSRPPTYQEKVPFVLDPLVALSDGS
jgi:hypothetical protein